MVPTVWRPALAPLAAKPACPFATVRARSSEHAGVRQSGSLRVLTAWDRTMRDNMENRADAQPGFDSAVEKTARPQHLFARPRHDPLGLAGEAAHPAAQPRSMSLRVRGDSSRMRGDTSRNSITGLVPMDDSSSSMMTSESASVASFSSVASVASVNNSIVPRHRNLPLSQSEIDWQPHTPPQIESPPQYGRMPRVANVTRVHIAATNSTECREEGADKSQQGCWSNDVISVTGSERSRGVKRVRELEYPKFASQEIDEKVDGKSEPSDFVGCADQAARVLMPQLLSRAVSDEHWELAGAWGCAGAAEGELQLEQAVVTCLRRMATKATRACTVAALASGTQGVMPRVNVLEGELAALESRAARLAELSCEDLPADPCWDVASLVVQETSQAVEEATRHAAPGDTFDFLERSLRRAAVIEDSLRSTHARLQESQRDEAQRCLSSTALAWSHLRGKPDAVLALARVP